MSDPPPVTGSGRGSEDNTRRDKDPRIVGRYELIREIGRGGVATVYLARQIDLDRLVALKELSTFHVSAAGSADRFLRESRLAGSLSHPNIVTVFEYFEHGGVPYIVMEYLPRGSLRPHLGHLSEAELAGVLEGVLAGLECAESSGVVHRDLKPENILVTADGHVKLTDFGIAKAAQQFEAESFRTAPGITVGTPSYMAPEQAMGQDVGPWTDLYSVGVMIWEHLVGHVPFNETDTPMARLLRHVNEQIPAPIEVNPDVDPALSDWVATLLVNDRRLRTQSAALAWNGLEEVIVARLGPLWRREARLSDVSAPGAPDDGTNDLTADIAVVPIVEPSLTEVRVPSIRPGSVIPDQSTSSHEMDSMDSVGDLSQPDGDLTDVIYIDGLAPGQLPHDPSQPPRSSEPSPGRGVEMALGAMAPPTEAPPTADAPARRRAFLGRRWRLIALVAALLLIAAIIEPVVLPSGTSVRTTAPVNIDNGAGHLVEHFVRPTTFHVDCRVTSGPVAGYYRETKAWWHFWGGDLFVPPAFPPPASAKNC